MTALQLANTAAPAFCTPTANALGTRVITGTAIGQINQTLQTAINNGQLNDMLQFIDLDDLTGTNATGFNLGFIDSILDPAKGTWPTTGNPIDWWFLANSDVVSQGLPTQLLSNGTISAHTLMVGPGTVTLPLSLGGASVVFQLEDTWLNAMIGNATDTPTPPPSQLASGLDVFETITGTGTNQGLCGNVTVQSLAQTPVPQVFTTGTTACEACGNTSHTYTYCGANSPVGATCNSLLDVVVGGCAVFGCFAPLVNPTQPDVAGNGGTVTTLTLGTNNKVTVSNADQDAYSSYFHVSLNRAHFTGETCQTSTDCQLGQTCSATNVCQ